MRDLVRGKRAKRAAACWIAEKIVLSLPSCSPLLHWTRVFWRSPSLDFLGFSDKPFRLVLQKSTEKKRSFAGDAWSHLHIFAPLKCWTWMACKLLQPTLSVPVLSLHPQPRVLLFLVHPKPLADFKEESKHLLKAPQRWLALTKRYAKAQRSDSHPMKFMYP